MTIVNPFDLLDGDVEDPSLFDLLNGKAEDPILFIVVQQKKQAAIDVAPTTNKGGLINGQAQPAKVLWMHDLEGEKIEISRM